MMAMRTDRHGTNRKLHESKFVAQKISLKVRFFNGKNLHVTNPNVLYKYFCCFNCGQYRMSCHKKWLVDATGPIRKNSKNSLTNIQVDKLLWMIGSKLVLVWCRINNQTSIISERLCSHSEIIARRYKECFCFEQINSKPLNDRLSKKSPVIIFERPND